MRGLIITRTLAAESLRKRTKQFQIAFRLKAYACAGGMTYAHFSASPTLRICRPIVSSARYFVYRYDGNADTDEVEFDPNMDTPIPKQNSVIARKGSNWKLASVQVEPTETASAAVPIFRVFLIPL